MKNIIETESHLITISQEKDCCDPTNNEKQYLSIETQDGGGGKFITIETERWSVESKKDWMALWDKKIGPLLEEK